MGLPSYSTAMLLLVISIFSVGLYFVFRSIQYLTHKQDELNKKVGHIQYRLNEVKTIVDRASTVKKDCVKYKKGLHYPKVVDRVCIEV